uniref:Uncharacterized protein n=1 Tax=Oryza barthii TaxID=65489 RepID=A0A0D3FTQ1_9ORYZ
MAGVWVFEDGMVRRADSEAPSRGRGVGGGGGGGKVLVHVPSSEVVTSYEVLERRELGWERYLNDPCLLQFTSAPPSTSSPCPATSPASSSSTCTTSSSRPATSSRSVTPPPLLPRHDRIDVYALIIIDMTFLDSGLRPDTPPWRLQSYVCIV